ncbi:MAG: cyclic peptide export ABC transporter [Longimicrobiaceae bacterium]
MKLLRYMLKVSAGLKMPRLTLIGMTVTGLASGFAMAALIGVINRWITSDGPPTAAFVWTFVALLLVRPALRLVAQILTLRVIEHNFFVIRIELCKRILATPMRHLEEVGRGRIMAGISNDVGSIASGVIALPGLAMNAAIVVGYMAYLGYLALPLLPVLLVLTAIGWVTFNWTMKKAVSQIASGRVLYDKVFERIQAMSEGTKELKMHARRREVWMEELKVVSKAHRREMRNSDVTLTFLATWTETLFFVAIAVLFLVTARWVHVDQATLAGYVLTVLMLRAPIEALNGALPAISGASVAMSNLDGLTSDLSKQVSDIAPYAPPRPGAAWKTVELKGVTHTYRRESDDERFTLGPVNLTLTPGEMVFIVGGNGSGKTTLGKMILGIYGPESGEVRLDGEVVTDAERDRYRQHFAVVFSDFFLFDALLGLESPELDADATRYLETLHLQHKVKVTEGRLSNVNLSSGQRKRLALLAAYLEDRPIYLFDEWAADQDPQFKEVFYRHLLPELKERGKTVLVISHDDRYFDVADRVIRLEDGAIRFDGPVEAYTAPRLVPVLPRVALPEPELQPA